MIYQYYKSKKNLYIYSKNEKDVIFFKSIFLNTRLPKYIRHEAAMKYFHLKKISVKKRCFLTNKSRSIFNHFKLSRIKLRWLASNNYINAIKKTNY